MATQTAHTLRRISRQARTLRPLTRRQHVGLDPIDLPLSLEQDRDLHEAMAALGDTVPADLAELERLTEAELAAVTAVGESLAFNASVEMVEA